jgi:Phytanoyl-CoA dioxygenase (PhyH)
MSFRTSSVDLLTKVAPGIAGRVSRVLRSVDQTSEHLRRLFGMPSPVWAMPKRWNRFTHDEPERLLDQLRRDGLIIIPAFLNAEQIVRVRTALEAGFLTPEVSRIKYRQTHKYYVCLQPLALCTEFADAAIDADLLNLVGAFFRRKPFLSEADFRRVLPLDMAVHEREDENFGKGYSSSHWHHDMHGRELKVMIYLTDVGPGDQNFVYLLGSHKGFRSTRFEASRFSDQQVDKMAYKRLECYASAGTAIVFDTNGIHRLRRFNTRVRDSVTLNYHPGRMCQSVPLIIHPESLGRNRPEFFRITSPQL